MNAEQPILDVRDLTISIDRRHGEPLEAVRDVSFSIRPGEALALIGESGSGKTLTAMSLLRLLPRNVRVSTGSAMFAGIDLFACSERHLRSVRGRGVGVVFQEPMSSLNPTSTVGRQIAEVVIRHQGVGSAAGRRRAIELLDQVGIPNASSRVDDYPHRFSGGMRQRVLIARAIANNPQLLLADEPTTALDVTVQAQILELLQRLQDEMNMALLLVTHDLGVVAEACDAVCVMYAGQIIETASTRNAIRTPQHPYTSLLLQSMPSGTEPRTRLATIGGVVPPLGDMPSGCRFAARCPLAREQCTTTEPELVPIGADGSMTRCLRVQRESIALDGVLT